ncbi:metal-dependent hydrolase [Piscinibacter sakaiensis]|uniref:metal-dependent hydrolase n=1 Tax=Piscinibacter sakaiensis TaxID=1547922 RepID=UPI003AAEA718
MDSLSQFALGAAVGVAVMGRRTAVWKAALWGGICGTLPDLDSFIDHGDPVSNMTLHRGDSHALFWLTLVAPALAWLPARLHDAGRGYRRWWLMVWLALVTHPLLDLMTVYGTQLGRPFTDFPFAVGSIFIIDPLYTLPLVVGLAIALRSGAQRGWRWNAAGLLLSTAYLGWSFAAQQHVSRIAGESIAAQGIDAQRVLVTPTAFNTVLWRVLVMTPGGYHEGFHSLLDSDRQVAFDRFDAGTELYQRLDGASPAVDRVARFSHGFFGLSQRDEQVLISDLRMGQEPSYIFTFVVARRLADRLNPLDVPRMAGSRPDVAAGLRWIWRRAAGERIAPPRHGASGLDPG